MGKAIGVEVKAAVKKASQWGMAVACGANDGVLILPSNIKKDRASLIDDSLGLYFPKDSDTGEIKAEGDISAYLRYDSLDLLIALAMGQTGGAPTQQGLTTAYAQSFTLADSLDGLFSTFCLNNNINIEEYTSVKVTGLTLKGEVGKPLQAAFHVIAIDKITSSAINILSTFDNVSYFETANRVLYSQGVIRMNSQSGPALGDGDKIYPNSFELSFKRKMAGVYGVGSSFDKIDEPTNDGVPECKLKLDFPRYSADTYFTDWDSGNKKKLDMTFTGASIETPYNRQFKLSFPNLKIANVDLPIEQGILKHPLELECLACDSAPLGMTGIVKPFQIDVINRKSTDVLG